jgi:ppGpp synthetase/RelA/SpoT-type nucleotidyltranferase
MKASPERFAKPRGAGAPVVNPAWLKAQIGAYAAQKERVYDPYARFLESVLGRLARRIAPLAIVQARAKGLVSFAEKAALKAGKYEDEPIHQMTDLCGARMILRTREEVDRVCAFLRQTFDVDERNSVDARSRLGSDQFGYTGFHLIVQVKPERGEVLGVEVPAALRRSIRADRLQRPRAEIQVRTIAEHFWADTFHDRIYKTSVRVPDAYKREAARMAAILEDADDNAGLLAARLDAYTGHYAAYLTEDEIRRKIAVLQVILDGERKPENRAGVALRMARMAAAVGDYDRVVELLREHEKAEPPVGWEIRQAYGAALCRRRAGSREGRALLERIEGDPECAAHLRAAAAMEAARSWALAPRGEKEAWEWYRKAVAHDPADPYALASFLEYDAFVHRAGAIPVGLRPVLEQAIATCREHARVGLELPRAHLTMARLHLLLDRPEQSLCAYAKAAEFCRTHATCLYLDHVDAELRFLERIDFGKDLSAEHEVIRRFLRLAEAVHGASRARAEIRKLAVRRGSPRRYVFMLVGGASLMPRDGLANFTDALKGALADFPGTVISGGTRAGIPGALGDIVASLAETGSCPFEAVAYLPEMIPTDATKDDRNYEIVKMAGGGFSAAQPLQAWIDLAAAGVRSEDVRVLGFDGGRIAALEYRIALALGATVCVVSGSGREAAGLLKDEDWCECPNLIVLPATCVEPMSLRALLYPPASDFGEAQLERLGQAVHENFRANNPQPEWPLSQRPWKELRADFKKSNREQAAYALQVLRLAGYEARPARPSSPLPKFRPAEVELMAKAEHGRWVIERLASGWRYGKTADKTNRISPYLCPWEQVPREIREYDRNAVRNFPAILARAGLRVARVKR